MRRRDFIKGIVGSTAWPVATHAQQRAMSVIGFVSSRTSGESAVQVAAFREGLGEKGFVEGNNLAIAFRWAEGHYDRLPALCSELVHQGVAVLVAAGGPPSALAAKAATLTTPIIFILASDPIKLGLVASLNHPGSNATGVALFAVAVEPKKLEILHELVPKTTQIGVLGKPAQSECTNYHD
jgi:ABC-type uncharacterized transport system substrate-binding protein